MRVQIDSRFVNKPVIDGSGAVTKKRILQVKTAEIAIDVNDGYHISLKNESDWKDVRMEGE